MTTSSICSILIKSYKNVGKKCRKLLFCNKKAGAAAKTQKTAAFRAFSAPVDMLFPLGTVFATLIYYLFFGGLL
jgi:hypothetical protein